MEIVHEVFTSHPQEIAQPSLLLLTSVASHRLTPFAQVLDLPLIGQTHQRDVHIEEEFVLRTYLQLFECTQPVAVCQTTDTMCVFFADSPLLDECLGKTLVINLFYVDALHATANGLQQFVRLFADHDEYCLLRGLLDEFQQFVGTFDVHALGQPDNADLIASLTGLQ